MADEEWSTLPRDIVDLLGAPRSLSDLADALGVTDARILWYLGKLRDAGHVVEEAGRWNRTAAGDELAGSPRPPLGDHTVLPVATVHDFVQAYADSAAGMFGPEIVQMSAEHAGRVPRERVVEFNERLLSLIAEYFAPDKIDPAATPKYGFHWILTPVDLHPLDD
jgi:biotin operon repressor